MRHKHQHREIEYIRHRSLRRNPFIKRLILCAMKNDPQSLKQHWHHTYAGRHSPMSIQFTLYDIAIRQWKPWDTSREPGLSDANTSRQPFLQFRTGILPQLFVQRLVFLFLLLPSNVIRFHCIVVAKSSDASLLGVVDILLVR